MKNDPSLRTVKSPYTDGEELRRACAHLMLHSCISIADERGNAQFLGPGLYFDDLFLNACAVGRRFMSVENVPTEDLLKNGTIQYHENQSFNGRRCDRSPNGAHFTNLVSPIGH